MHHQSEPAAKENSQGRPYTRKLAQLEQNRLRGVGLRHASQAELSVRDGRQHNIMRLNAGKLFKDGAGRISQACALLPHLQGLPEDEGEEADQDMCLDAILALMPDRTHAEFVLLDAKRRFGLRELNVGLPELLLVPISDIGA